LKPAEQKVHLKSGLVKIEPQWGSASSGRVTIKVYRGGWHRGRFTFDNVCSHTQSLAARPSIRDVKRRRTIHRAGSPGRVMVPARSGDNAPAVLTTSAAGYAAEEKAAATRRAYRSDWRHFQ
jgi:hypothetical protein